MNLDEVFGLTEEMPLVSINPLALFACMAVSLGIGWFCAYRYRNIYDVEKSIRLYIPLAIGAAVLFTVLGIPVLFAVGVQLFGFVAMLLLSNRYFKKN